MTRAPTYLGEIISVSGASLQVELTPQVRSGLLIIEGRTHRIGQVGSFVRIPQGYNDLYGVISETSETVSIDESEFGERRLIKVELVGESIGAEFERGIGQYPSINEEAHLVTEQDLKKIYGSHSEGQIVIGKLSSSDSVNVSVDLDNLVNRHSALLGSTGSGKSTSVASLLRSIVKDDDAGLSLPSARIVLFDIHGEYSSALGDISSIYSVTPQAGEEKLCIPYWCVSPDNLIDFLCGANENVKNHFIDAIVAEKKQFVIDNKLDIEIEKITPYTPLPFRLQKIWYDLVHADNVNWKDEDKSEPAYAENGKGDVEKLIAPRFEPPGAAKNPPHKGGAQSMKKQLDLMRSRLLEGQYSFFLHPDKWKPNSKNKIESDLADLIKLWIGRANPITILDLSGMPSSRLDLLLGSVLDVLFESSIWGRNLDSGMRKLPLLLVMEEAHRYLAKENSGLAKDMVRRIAKEGRKFGVGSMLISQRPSEIDETILSQCGTLFALRINNATDRTRVKSAMSDGLSGIVDSLPILRTGEAIVTGEAAKLPMRVRFKIPPKGKFPDSRDPEVTKSWAEPYEDRDYSSLVKSWRLQNAHIIEK